MSDDNRSYPDHATDHGTISPQVSEKETLGFIADLERAGIPDDVIQQHIKDLGLEGKYDTSPGAQATRQLDVLKRDPEFVRRLNAGDPEANELFANLCYAKAIDVPDEKPIAPEAYRFDQHPVVQGLDPAKVQEFDTQTREWAHSLQMPVATATAVATLVADNAAIMQRLSPDEQANHGHRQEQVMRNALSRYGDVDAQLNAAQAALLKQSGRTIDLVAVAKTSGVNAAMEILWHAQALARKS
jgi:hypothetical protein